MQLSCVFGRLSAWLSVGLWRAFWLSQNQPMSSSFVAHSAAKMMWKIHLLGLAGCIVGNTSRS